MLSRAAIIATLLASAIASPCSTNGDCGELPGCCVMAARGRRLLQDGTCAPFGVEGDACYDKATESGRLDPAGSETSCACADGFSCAPSYPAQHEVPQGRMGMCTASCSTSNPDGFCPGACNVCDGGQCLPTSAAAPQCVSDQDCVDGGLGTTCNDSVCPVVCESPPECSAVDKCPGACEVCENGQCLVTAGAPPQCGSDQDCVDAGLGSTCDTSGCSAVCTGDMACGANNPCPNECEWRCDAGHCLSLTLNHECEIDTDCAKGTCDTSACENVCQAPTACVCGETCNDGTVSGTCQPDGSCSTNVQAPDCTPTACVCGEACTDGAVSGTCQPNGSCSDNIQAPDCTPPTACVCGEPCTDGTVSGTCQPNGSCANNVQAPDCTPKPCVCGERCTDGTVSGTCQPNGSCSDNIQAPDCTPTACVCGEPCTDGTVSGTCQPNGSCANNIQAPDCSACSAEKPCPGACEVCENGECLATPGAAPQCDVDQDCVDKELGSTCDTSGCSAVCTGETGCPKTCPTTAEVETSCAAGQHVVGDCCPECHWNCNTREVWGAEKTAWCCENEEKGCTDCSTVKCESQESVEAKCSNGLVTQGECCPFCDCSTVRCAASPESVADTCDGIVKDGGCCHFCDCSTVKCASPEVVKTECDKEGGTVVHRPCCDACEPAATDCTKVTCPDADTQQKECDDKGGKIVQGDCCPECSTTAPVECVCTEEYQPVCGADGETYGNLCSYRCKSAAGSYTEGACAAGDECDDDSLSVKETLFLTADYCGVNGKDCKDFDSCVSTVCESYLDGGKCKDVVDYFADCLGRRIVKRLNALIREVDGCADAITSSAGASTASAVALLLPLAVAVFIF